MSVGQSIDKATLDAQLSSFSKQFTSLLGQVQTYAAHVDALTDPSLVALGYVSGTDVSLLRSSYRDLERIRQVYQGVGQMGSGVLFTSGTVGSYDFRSFLKQVDGIGYLLAWALTAAASMAGAVTGGVSTFFA